MANIADCAFAVAKDDLNKMNGAIRRAEEGEQPRVVYKRVYKHKETGEICSLYEEYNSSRWSVSKIKLVKGGHTIKEWEGDDCKNCNAVDELHNKGYELHTSKDVVNKTVGNGWAIDWIKLDSYSYDYDPWVQEYEDHITVFFGGRWNFPSKLEDKLNEFGVRWQGAGCDECMDWKFDDGGNTDFGIRIKEEDCGDYTNWYCADESKAIKKEN